MKNINSLILSLCLFPLGMLLLTGCDSGKIEELYEELVSTGEELEVCQEEKEELEKRLEELQSKLESLEDLTARVVSDYADLEYEVSDFDHEDWENNVPDVESASEELYYSVRNLQNEF
jgi:chromosome segregation ATPase